MDKLLDATARAEREHFWFRGFRRFVAPLLARAAGQRTDLRILDCGCGTGNNLRMLRRYGRATGIDLTFSGLAYARRQGERLVARASAGRGHTWRGPYASACAGPPASDRQRIPRIVLRRERQHVALDNPVPGTVRGQRSGAGRLALDHVGKGLVLKVDDRPAVRRNPPVARYSG